MRPSSAVLYHASLARMKSPLAACEGRALRRKLVLWHETRGGGKPVGSGGLTPRVAGVAEVTVAWTILKSNRDPGRVARARRQRLAASIFFVLCLLVGCTSS